MDMRRSGRPLTAVGVILAAGALLTAISWATAADKPNKPDKAAKLAKLLERNPEADTDNDDVLTEEEAKAFFAKQRGADRKGPGGPGGPPPWGMGMGGRPDPAKILAEHPEADTDKDGKLSPDEMRACMQGQMAAKILAEHPDADTDGDGKLDPKELRAAMAKYGRDGGQRPMHPGMMVNWLIEHFDEADTDGNGQLSKDELIALRDKFPAPGEMGPGFGPDRERGPRMDRDKGRDRPGRQRKGQDKDTDKDKDKPEN